MVGKKVTILDIQRAKSEGKKLTMLTAYDYPFAQLIDSVGIDIILVGDSLGMVVMGLDGTVQVTMEDMIHHIRAVMRGCVNSFVVGDMPFMSYNTSITEAIKNAGRLIKEGGCEAVKLEGGINFAPTIEAIVKAGIPVQGHIGLTPQTSSALGGFKVQGRDILGAKQLLSDAKAIESSGAFSIIIEAVPAPVGEIIAKNVSIPVIGIGSGPYVDGQVLVTHDLLGLFDRFVPKFVKQYSQLRSIIVESLSEYKNEVLQGSFPGPDHSFSMPNDLVNEIKHSL